MSIDSVLASAPRPRGCSAPLTQTSNGVRARPPLVGRHLADEQREVAERVLDHVGPRGVAGRQLGAARPAQGRQHRLRQALEREAAVGAVDLRAAPAGPTAAASALSTAPSTLFGR